MYRCRKSVISLILERNACDICVPQDLPLKYSEHVNEPTYALLINAGNADWCDKHHKTPRDKL